MKSWKKKTVKAIAASVVALSVGVSFIGGCDLNIPFLSGTSSATYVRLNKEELTMYVGDTALLSAETDGFGIKWSSDDEDIATVDDGEVTAVAVGETIIAVSVGSLFAECEVKVLEKKDDDDDPGKDDPSKDDPGKDDPDDPNKDDPGKDDPDDPNKDDPGKDDPDDPGKDNPGEDDPVTSGNLKDIYRNYFVIGAAVQTGKLTGNGYGNLMSHFNSISPENNMKWKNVSSSEGVYNFNQSGDSADKLITWAKNNGVGVRGHCLLWYKSLPTWLHNKFDGVAYSEAVKNSAYSYIDNNIETVMKHFGNNVYVWDVVNEALFNSVSANKLADTSKGPYGNIWRTDDGMSAENSDWVDWYKVTGGYEYIAHAFKKAAEVRSANNLNVDLYYNDYSLNDPNKRQACLNLLQMLKDNGAPIDGVGMQAHYKLDAYTANREQWIKNFEDSIKAFIEAGVDVQITELDIRFDGALTAQVEADQAEMFGKIFEVARKYAKINGAEHGVTGVTTWGVQDGCNGSWGDNQYPLIFGTDKLPKQAYYEIINFSKYKSVKYEITPGSNSVAAENPGKWYYSCDGKNGEDYELTNAAVYTDNSIVFAFNRMAAEGNPAYKLSYQPLFAVGTNYTVTFTVEVTAACKVIYGTDYKAHDFSEAGTQTITWSGAVSATLPFLIQVRSTDRSSPITMKITDITFTK